MPWTTNGREGGREERVSGPIPRRLEPSAPSMGFSSLPLLSVMAAAATAAAAAAAGALFRSRRHIAT